MQSLEPSPIPKGRSKTPPRPLRETLRIRMGKPAGKADTSDSLKLLVLQNDARSVRAFSRRSRQWLPATAQTSLPNPTLQAFPSSSSARGPGVKRKPAHQPDTVGGRVCLYNGERKDRTLDSQSAILALSQLSYRPIMCESNLVLEVTGACTEGSRSRQASAP